MSIGFNPGTGGGSGTVDLVNGQAPDENGDVVIDADNIGDESTTNKFASQSELDLIAGWDAATLITGDLTDVGDAAWVRQNTDGLGTNEDTSVPTAMLVAASIETAVTNGVAGLIDSSDDSVNDIMAGEIGDRPAAGNAGRVYLVLPTA